MATKNVSSWMWYCMWCRVCVANWGTNQLLSNTVIHFSTLWESKPQSTLKGKICKGVGLENQCDHEGDLKANCQHKTTLKRRERKLNSEGLLKNKQIASRPSSNPRSAQMSLNTYRQRGRLNQGQPVTENRTQNTADGENWQTGAWI